MLPEMDPEERPGAPDCERGKVGGTWEGEREGKKEKMEGKRREGR